MAPRTHDQKTINSPVSFCTLFDDYLVSFHDGKLTISDDIGDDIWIRIHVCINFISPSRLIGSGSLCGVAFKTKRVVALQKETVAYNLVLENED